MILDCLALLLPNIGMLISYGIIAYYMVRRAVHLEEYVEELTACLVLCVLSNLGHLLWIFAGIKNLSYIADPSSFTVSAIVAYSIWRDQHDN
jgi:hypothetical protein